jgi:hypothetical protein
LGLLLEPVTTCGADRDQVNVVLLGLVILKLAGPVANAATEASFQYVGPDQTVGSPASGSSLPARHSATASAPSSTTVAASPTRAPGGSVRPVDLEV